VQFPLLSPRGFLGSRHARCPRCLGLSMWPFRDSVRQRARLDLMDLVAAVSDRHHHGTVTSRFDGVPPS
jgi:hypothetical protein